jgi:hypothetical protein
MELMFDLPIQNEELTEDFCLLQLLVDFPHRVGKIRRFTPNHLVIVRVYQHHAVAVRSPLTGVAAAKK